MKTENEFRSFYRSTLQTSLLELNKLRRQTRVKNIRITLLYILFLALLFLIGFVVNRMIYGVCFTENKANVPIILTVIVVILSLFYYFGLIHANRKKFVSRYKNDIISSIVQFIDESLLYEAENHVPQREFIASGLFYPKPDRYSGDDCVSGKIDKTKIAFSEIHAQYKTVVSDDDGKSERWIPLFDGLFFKADFNKHFKGEYFVLPDRAEKLFGRTGKLFHSSKNRFGELIRLEDPEFEKEFVVYGTDQVEARYILSTSLMRRLLDFKQRTGKKMQVSFVKSSLYIAIPYRKPLFEPRYYSTILSEDKTTEYFLDLELAIAIVTELNLNTRIWSKQ